MITLAIGAMFSPTAAYAHPAGSTLLTISLKNGAVQLDAEVALSRVDIALGMHLADNPPAAIAANEAALRGVFETGVEVVGSRNTPWAITVDTLEAGSVDGIAQLHAALTATPPPGTAADTFTLTYRVVAEQIVTHNIYVAASDADGANQLLGTITHRHPTLVISLTHPRGVGLTSMIGRGIEHFRTGTDHVIFITLLAAGTAFSRQKARRRIADLAIRTTTFTIGHSVSLSLAAAGLVTPPSRVVEVGIAVTILLGAIHLANQIVPRRAEAGIAMLFGLIHGFGFADTLHNLGLSGRALVVPTVGFNIGLEIAQLAADVAISLPMWWLAGRHWSRLGVAVPVSFVACSWIIQRSFDVSNPLEPFINTLAQTPERLALVLAAIAGLAALAAKANTARSNANLHS